MTSPSYNSDISLALTVTEALYSPSPSRSLFICYLLFTICIRSIVTGYITAKLLLEIDDPKILNDLVILEIATMQYGIELEMLVDRSQSRLSTSAVKVAKLVHVKNLCKWYNDLARVRAMVTLKASTFTEMSSNAAAESTPADPAKSAHLIRGQLLPFSRSDAASVRELQYCKSIEIIEELRHSITHDVYPAVPDHTAATGWFISGILAGLHVSAAQVSFTATDWSTSATTTVDMSISAERMFRSTELLSTCADHIRQAMKFSDTTDAGLYERLEEAELLSPKAISRLAALEDAVFERLATDLPTQAWNSEFANAGQAMDVPIFGFRGFCDSFKRLEVFKAEHSEAQQMLLEHQSASQECKTLIDKATTELDEFQNSQSAILLREKYCLINLLESPPQNSPRQSETEHALVHFLRGHARLLTATGAKEENAALADLQAGGAIMAAAITTKGKAVHEQHLLSDLIRVHTAIGFLRRYGRSNNPDDLCESVASLEAVVLAEERPHDIELHYAQLLWNDVLKAFTKDNTT